MFQLLENRWIKGRKMKEPGPDAVTQFKLWGISDCTSRLFEPPNKSMHLCTLYSAVLLSYCKLFCSSISSACLSSLPTSISCFLLLTEQGPSFQPERTLRLHLLFPEFPRSRRSLLEDVSPNVHPRLKVLHHLRTVASDDHLHHSSLSPTLLRYFQPATFRTISPLHKIAGNNPNRAS